jgi:predicted transcriptional regulator
MAEDKAPARRRRLGAHGMMFRRRRIFARLREGWTYEEIANGEGVTITRIRQIVSKELEQRAVDSGAEHAKLQLERLVPAIQLAAEAIAAGDVSAITPYLKALDRLDRYQTVASAEQVYDDEARKKLMDRVNSIAENLGINEDFAAAVRAHLKKTGQIPADEPAEAGGEEADMAAAPEFGGEASALEASCAEAGADSGFFYLNPS